jgi:hypothetical protein
MPKKNGDATAKEAEVLLTAAMKAICADQVEWFAIAWKTKDGVTMRARTHAAPKSIRLPA